MAPEATPGGCICAVFHLFDLHPFQFPLNQQHHPDSIDFLKQEPHSSKGIEAPRNSLETEEAMNQEEDLNFPGGLQIKTRVSTTSTAEDMCSTTSPGTTTPSLVARLMGLDMLPHCNSPSSTSTISRLQTKSRSNRRKERNIHTRRSRRSFSDDDITVGVRSLPETPRMSLGRRSDVESHRLSLNVNKENVNEEFSGGRRRGRLRQDEDRSPGNGNYAKQLANQVRESVSRRAGLDITNISRDKEIIRRDENLIPLKPNKNHIKFSPPSLEDEMRPDEGKQALRLPDIKKNKQVPTSGTRNPRIPTSCHKGISDPLRSNSRVKNRVGIPSSNLKKFHPQWPYQAAIRNKKEEAFVHSAGSKKANLTDKKKSKKAPLSNELLKTSGPTLLPAKKVPSPPATKLPQKQTQASDALTSKRNTQLCSSKKSHSYKQLHLDLEPVNTAPDSNAPAVAEYRYYIQRILKRTGIIDGATPLKLGKWHTSSHPLDPSIFYYLELFHPSAGASSSAFLSRRCNRKLIFHVVDELLAKILKPYLDYRPWGFRITSQIGVIDELCGRIEGFPGSKCEVLEDIDRLIQGDLCNWQMGECWEEEGAELARDIEGEIMDSLLRETVEILGHGSPYRGLGINTDRRCHVAFHVT